MKPWEFWQLTNADFIDLIEGYKLKNDHEMQRLAWHASNIMNVHLKKKVNPDRLLGKGRAPMTQADREAELEKFRRVLDKQRGAK